MENSSTKKLCRHCGEEDDRIQAGKYPDGKNKRWVNTKGQYWAGLRCPACNLLRISVSMKALRQKRSVERHEALMQGMRDRAAKLEELVKQVNEKNEAELEAQVEQAVASAMKQDND